MVDLYLMYYVKELEICYEKATQKTQDSETGRLYFCGCIFVKFYQVAVKVLVSNCNTAKTSLTRPAPQSHSHDFCRYTNSYVCMYVCMTFSRGQKYDKL